MEQWKKDITENNEFLEKVRKRAAEITRMHFPEGTKFDLGKQRYRVKLTSFLWWSDPHEVKVENVNNSRERIIDVHFHMDRIKNVTKPNLTDAKS